MRELKVGVYICRCGGNISDYVDCNRIRDEVATWPNVAVSRIEIYLCSKPSLDTMVKDITQKEHALKY